LKTGIPNSQIYKPVRCKCIEGHRK
jgi:hypothetical protein